MPALLGLGGEPVCPSGHMPRQSASVVSGDHSEPAAPEPSVEQMTSRYGSFMGETGALLSGIMG